VFNVRSVSFAYSPDSANVFSDVSFCLSPGGGRICVLGPSGIGKTTLIALLGLLAGTKFSGQISYQLRDGTTLDFGCIAPDEIERLRRTEFGFALQNSYLLPHLTVLDNLVMPLGLNGFSEADRRSRGLELLSLMSDLEERWNSPVDKLSGGQKQRVAVLRSVIHHPRVLFADEPFSALDDENRRLILDVLMKWQSKDLPGQQKNGDNLLFLVCHDEDVANEYATSFLRMDGSGVCLTEKGSTVT